MCGFDSNENFSVKHIKSCITKSICVCDGNENLSVTHVKSYIIKTICVYDGNKNLSVYHCKPCVIITEVFITVMETSICTMYSQSYIFE